MLSKLRSTPDGATGPGTGVVSVVERRFPSNDGGHITSGPLDHPLGPSRQVVEELHLAEPQPVEVDEVHVSSQARDQGPAIVQAKMLGWVAGELVDGPFERHRRPRCGPGPTVSARSWES